MRTQVLVSLLLVFTSYYTNAQNDFRPGKVFLSNGDTLSGEINFNSRSATYIQMRSGEYKELRTFTIEDLNGYTIEDVLFMKRIVNVDQVFSNSYVFLETLVPGKMALLSFKTSANKAYYFFEKDNILYYLRGGTIRVYQDGRPFDKDIRDYYGLLKYHTLDCEKLKNNFPDFKYNQEALMEVVENYNSCFEENSIVKTSKKSNPSKVKKLFGLKAGANYPIFNIEGNNDFYTYKITPTFGAFMSIPFGGSNKNLSAVLELTYSWRQAVPSQSGRERRYRNIDFALVEFHPLLRYTFAKGLVRPLVSAGGYFGLATKNNFLIAGREIKTFLIGYQAETGIIIPVSKKIISLTARAQRTYYDIDLKSWNLTLAAGLGF
jgi:hypothetical protein